MNEHRFSLEKKKGKEESEDFFFAFVSGWAALGVRVCCIQVGTTVFAHLGLSRGMNEWEAGRLYFGIQRFNYRRVSCLI